MTEGLDRRTDVMFVFTVVRSIIVNSRNLSAVISDEYVWLNVLVVGALGIRAR